MELVSPPGHDPSLRAAFKRRWPSTTSPSLRARTGILKPNSRMLAAHSIDDSVILPRVADVEDELIDVPNLNFCFFCLEIGFFIRFGCFGLAGWPTRRHGRAQPPLTA